MTTSHVPIRIDPPKPPTAVGAGAPQPEDKPTHYARVWRRLEKLDGVWQNVGQWLYGVFEVRPLIDECIVMELALDEMDALEQARQLLRRIGGIGCEVVQ